MDKYEYQVCADQIKSFIAEQKYVEAMEIADTIDWHRVKSVSMLCTVSEIYKYNKRYEDSRDVLLLAYERHPSGRMIIYSLCELAIKMNDVVSAVEYYKEFVRVAPGDTGSYILLYKIYEAQEVSIEERIKVLEEYKRRDYKEKWAYELAKLYHKTGQESKCIDECDELILWFGEGKYVRKAMELKAQHQGIASLKQGYNTAPSSTPGTQGYGPAPEGQVSSGGQQSFPTGQQAGYDKPQEYEMPAQEVTVPGYNTENLQNELQQSMEQYLSSTENAGYTPYEYQDHSDFVSQQTPVYENDMAAQESIEPSVTGEGIVTQQVEPEIPEKTQEFVFDPNNNYVQQFMNQFQGAPEKADADSEQAPQEIDFSAEAAEVATETEAESEVVAEAAGSDVESEIGSEAEAGAEPEDASDVAVIEAEQTDVDEDKKEAPNKYENILGQEYNGQLRMSLPDTDMVEKQITGQIDIGEILRKREERLRREFGEDNPEISRTQELLLQLEGVIPGTEGTIKSVEESKPIITEINVPPEQPVDLSVDEEADTESREPEESIEEAPEEAIEVAEEAETLTVASEESEDTEAGVSEEENVASEEQIVEKAEDASKEAEAGAEEEEKAPQPTFEYELDDYGEVEELEDIEQPDEVDDIIKTSNLPLEEIAQYNALAEQALHQESEPELPPNYDENGRMKHPSYMVLEEARKSRRDFDENEYKLFGRYDGIESVKAQLVDVIDDMSMQAGKGNVVVMGDEVSLRKALSIDLVKAMQIMDSTFMGKVAKISGEALNKKNIPATLKKLNNGALIIEEAGGLSAAALTIIAQSLTRDVESVLIVLEGSRESISPLLEANPAMFDIVFDARIDIEEFSNDDLVAYAKGYAREQEHSIDEMGILALYTRIGELQALDNKVTVEDIKELIDTAIAHVDKMTLSHLMDVLVSKRYDDDDFIIIREKDFLLDGKKQEKLEKKQKKNK